MENNLISTISKFESNSTDLQTRADAIIDVFLDIKGHHLVLKDLYDYLNIESQHLKKEYEAYS